MRTYVGILAVLLAGCAANPSSPTAADNGPAARCTVSKCFNARDVRSVQIIDASTAVAYVGQQRCPFVVDLDGINCSPTFGPHIQLPKIQFYQGGGAANANIGLISRVCSADQQLYLYTGIPNPGPLTPDGPIDPVTGRPLGVGLPADSPVRPLGGISTLPPYGSGELGSLGPTGGGPASVPVVPLNSTDLCRVRDIHSITDDQLIELYVKAKVTPPPPPIGSGQIAVPAAQSATSPTVGGAAQSAAPPNTGAAQSAAAPSAGSAGSAASQPASAPASGNAGGAGASGGAEP